MAIQDTARQYDGWMSLEGGIDSGHVPTILKPNQCAWAVNTTFRGGYAQPRPGFKKHTLSLAAQFGNDAALKAQFEDGFFQGASSYVTDDGRVFLVAAVSGSVFTLDLQNAFRVSSIYNGFNPNKSHVYFQQAERYLVGQDTQSAPMLFDGATARASNISDEVPTGGPMAYGRGRLWVASRNTYTGGDLVWSDAALGRDSVIKFTENTFLAEGGSFAVPTVANQSITGLAFAAAVDTAMGDGDLLVFTPNAVFAFSAPIDREVWADLEYPIQRFGLLDYGAVSHESIVKVNGDLFFRAQDGIRSFVLARRDFNTWGNTPVSGEVSRALKYDTPLWLSACSGVHVDNRYLCTAQPVYTAHGIYHRALLVLDFDLITTMTGKAPPAWEGAWTGLKVLQIVKLRHEGSERCFVFALSAANKVELWELTTADRFDFNGTDDVRIQWVIESRGMTCGKPMDLKRLLTADVWRDRLAGTVDWTVRYRTDGNDVWNLWTTFQDCANYRNCETFDCADPGNPELPVYFVEQVRNRKGLPQPGASMDTLDGKLKRDGFDFQVRFEMTGHARIRKCRLVADRIAEDQFGNLTGVTCVAPSEAECAAGCQTLASCEQSDYAYVIT